MVSKEPKWLRNQLGIAVASQTHERYRHLRDSPRSERIFNAGGRAQRLLWASTGTKDPNASDTLYVHALATPFTVNTMPEETLKTLADHGDIDGCIPARACKGDEVLAKFNKAGIHIEALGDQLQVEGAASFVKPWNELLQCIASKMRDTQSRLNPRGKNVVRKLVAPILDPTECNTRLGGLICWS